MDMEEEWFLNFYQRKFGVQRHELPKVEKDQNGNWGIPGNKYVAKGVSQVQARGLFHRSVRYVPMGPKSKYMMVAEETRPFYQNVEIINKNKRVESHVLTNDKVIELLMKGNQKLQKFQKLRVWQSLFQSGGFRITASVHTNGDSPHITIRPTLPELLNKTEGQIHIYVSPCNKTCYRPGNECVEWNGIGLHATELTYGNIYTKRKRPPGPEASAPNKKNKKKRS